jgi:hypothetical protein
MLGLLSLPLAVRASAASLRYHDQLGKLTPANVATIATHLVTSVLLALGLVIAGRL